MADPLSATASIIAVVGAANAVFKGLRRLKAAKDAPEGLQDLMLDVAQLEMVLNDVKNVVLDSESPPSNLATLIGEAGSKLLELQSLIEYTLTKAGASDKVDRWQWLRKSNEVERLRNQLGTIRLNLVALTSSANFGVLQRVSIVTQDLSSEQQRLNAQMTSVFSRQEALLHHMCQRIEECQAIQAAMTRLLGNFRQVNAYVASDNAPPLSRSLGRPAVTPVVARPRMRSRNEFHIQNLQIQLVCPPDCTCSCHQTWGIYSPMALRRIFGYSKIEGAELPFFKRTCSLQSCKGKRATFINVNFFLPAMMASRMISLWFTSSPLYGPELLLKVPRVVRSNTPADRAICFGDLDDVKRSISAGDFKPWDLDWTGQSLIARALDYRKFTIALYLAQAASDDYEYFTEDYNLWWLSLSRWWILYYSFRESRFTPKMTVLSTLIMNLGLSRLKLDIVPGMNWNELLDMNGFSEIHKIVFGIGSRPLDAEIDARPEDLDRPDSVGLTALWWACWFGNSSHIKILMQHGAGENDVRVALIGAALWSGSYDSLEQLLDAGASFPGWSIEHLFCILISFPSDRGVDDALAIDKAIFGRFLNLDYRCGQATPMIDLARQSTPTSSARIKQLLELGANIELADERGLTALCHAISAGNSEACKILGRAGANASIRTNTGGTILHTAVRTAFHPSLIQAMSELDFSGVELGATDESGYTAFELLEIRARRRRKNQPGFPPLHYDGCPHKWDNFPFGLFLRHFCVNDVDTELEILLSFENLLQQVQEVQNVPIENRYPLLGLTRESLMIDPNKDSLLTTIMPSAPGAWPEVGYDFPQCPHFNLNSGFSSHPIYI